jgi:hypothetical protein
VICTKKKVDITAAKKPAVVIPKTLKRLSEGHRCTTQGALITKEERQVIIDKIANAPTSNKYNTEQQAALHKDNEYRWALKPADCSARAIALQ